MTVDNQVDRNDNNGAFSGTFSSRKRTVVLATTLGLLLGLSSFTFQYGEGLSYFSKDPAACMNCHIMKPQFDSWQKASHHTFATCVDCHLPHDFFGKYMAKAENGWNHSRAFTMQDFHEPILINEKNRRILQQNCLACHADLVHDLVVDDAVDCMHCHRSAGHGESVGLGGPERPDEQRGGGQ